MNTPEVFERLRATQGEAAYGLVTDNPDPFFFVQTAKLGDVSHYLRSDADLQFDYLMSISGVDLKTKLHLVYHLFSYVYRHLLVMKVEVPYDALSVPSVSKIWPAANWHEREQYDLFGFQFTGHPDLRRILLPDDWVGHPLRKDYEYPDEYHGIDHYRADPKAQFKALDDLVAKAKQKKQEQDDSGTAH